MERLRSFLTSLEKLSASCSYARSDKDSNSYALSASKDLFSDFWVIDSGSTDHMTNSFHQFASCSPCLGNKKIIVADGTLPGMVGQELFP